MPFKSQAQRKFMYAKHPAMAAEWQAHTPKGAKLPEHVKKADVFFSAFSDELQKSAGSWGWIHDRAEHILAKNPDMKKSTAFAVATEQGHSLDKTPKGYGTAEGKAEAKKKYDTPKGDVQQANPGDLKTPKLSDEPKKKWTGEHFVEKSAFADELEQILKEGGLGETVGKALTAPIEGTPKWLMGRGPTKEIVGKLKSMPKVPTYTGGRAAPGVYDVSRMAHQMGV